MHGARRAMLLRVRRRRRTQPEYLSGDLDEEAGEECQVDDIEESVQDIESAGFARLGDPIATDEPRNLFGRDARMVSFGRVRECVNGRAGLPFDRRARR